jgi:uncharacterized protein YndB with AHSA1/START domain/DNA-binding transcriptional ArsR family regulator
MAARLGKGEGKMDPVFRALSDPGRRQLLDSLNASNGQTLQQLCAGMAMTRQAVSKHLVVLEEANLVTTVRRGREKLHYLNAAPVADIADRWISHYHRQRVRVLSGLKHTLEVPAMDKPEFVYTTYIKTTPEELWHALIDPTFTARYWGMTFHTDWEEGSTYVMEQRGARVADEKQVILVSDPPRRLSYTWHTFTPEWAEAQGIEGDFLAEVTAEPRSKVTFDIEPAGEMVKLTVVHDGFDAGGTVQRAISQGWPVVLSNLKTLLETGDVPIIAMEITAKARS